MERIKKNFLKESSYVEFVFVFLILIWAPVEFYYLNMNEFWFSLKDIISSCFLVFFLGFIFIFFVLYIVNEKIRLMFISFFTSLTVGLYIQGNWINEDYGLLNGESIPWENYGLYGLFNIIFWVAIIFFPFILLRFLKRRKWMKAIIYINSIIFFILLSSMVIFGVTFELNKQSQNESGIVTDKDIFTLGDEKNVVVFILDSFDSNLYDSILNDDNGVYHFDDFTYYRNTTGMYPTTQGGIPNIITGKEYCNQMPYRDWLEKAYGEAEIFRILKKGDYQVGIYETDFIAKRESKNLIDNIDFSSKSTIEDKNGLFFKYMQFIMFRYLPHHLKKYFVVYTGALEQYKSDNEYIIDDVIFYEKLLNKKILLETGTSNYRVYHLQGAHPPFLYDANVHPIDGIDQIQQAKGSLNIVKEYMNQLKLLGIYDQTAIIICADHGSASWSELSQSPLLMIKGIKEVHDFLINDFPVSYSNLNGSIMTLIDNDEKRSTIWSNTEEPLDQRRFLYYALEEKDRDMNYMPRMYEYWIGTEMSDLRKGSYYYDQSGIQNIEYFNIKDKLEIDITDDKQYLKLVDYGMMYFPHFSNNSSYRWTSGYETQFTTVFDKKDCDYKMEISVMTTLGVQDVICYIEGEKIFESVVDGNISLVIPKELITDEKTQIVLKWPKADRAENVIKDSRDNSIYAIGIQKIIFQALDR